MRRLCCVLWVCLGLGLAQTEWNYQGQINRLEFVGACPTDLPTQLAVRLVANGSQSYLVGPSLVAGLLEGETLSFPTPERAAFAVKPSPNWGAKQIGLELILINPPQGCALSQAHLELSLSSEAAGPWLGLARLEYQANRSTDLNQKADLLEQSFALSQSLRGETALVWQQRTQQALALEQLQRSGEAFVLYQEAAEHLQALEGPNHPDTLIARQGMASSLVGINRYEEAIALSRNLVSQTEQSLGPNHLQTFNALRNLANALNRVGRNTEALAIYRTVYERSRQAYGNDPRTLNEWRGYANGLYLASQKTEALQEMLEVYGAAQKLGQTHYETLMALEQLANFSLALGQTDNALKYLELAETGWSQKLGNSPTRQRLMATRGWILWNQGRIAEARPLLAQSVEDLERLRAQPIPAEERRRLLSENLETYQNYILLLAETGDLSEVFRVSELTKGRTLLDSLASQQANQAALLPPDLLRQLQDLEQRFAQAEQALQTAEEPQRGQLLALRLRLTQQAADLQKSLDRYPRYQALRQPKLWELKQTAEVLPPDAAFISFIDLNPVLMVLIVTPGQSYGVALPAPPNLSATLGAYRKLLETPDGALGLERQGLRVYRLPDGSYGLFPTREAPPPGAQRVGDWKAISQALGNVLLEPLHKYLGASVKRLIISPDGPLAFLPFETLSYDQGLLLERFAVRYTPSFSVYAQVQQVSPRHQQDLLALGNPNYPSNIQPSSATRALFGTLKQRNFPLVSLPGAEKEAQAAAQLFAPHSEAWVGPEASLQKLQALSQSGALARYRFLLLAAHGFVDSESPEQVAILLSQTPTDDGVLGLPQVLQLRLQSDLVILSACNSGLGKTIRGEGVLGLAYAFYLAGSRNTLLTEWAINDSSSSQFSPRLLERLKQGQSTDDALQQTKLEFLHSGLSHPAYWAAFVLY